jgi:hypothetical protein
MFCGSFSQDGEVNRILRTLVAGHRRRGKHVHLGRRRIRQNGGYGKAIGRDRARLIAAENVHRGGFFDGCQSRHQNTFAGQFLSP